MNYSKKTYFTLIELMIVCAMIACLGGGLILAISSAENHSYGNLLKKEQQLIYTALIKFKKDTGHYPKTGTLDKSHVDLEYNTPTNTADFTDEEFDHSSNFHQLFYKPIDKDDSSRWNWNIDSKRGWRGPYLHISTLEGLFKIPALGKSSPLKKGDGSHFHYEYDHEKSKLTLTLPASKSPTGKTFISELDLP